MAVITRRITNNLNYQFTIPCPGDNNNQNANLIIPASVVNLDLLTLTTEDNLWTLQPQLLALQRQGSITVTGTVDTASFDYEGVSTIQADSNPPLNDAVTLISGSHITLAQVGQNITVNATGELSAALTDNHIFVGNGSNVATDVAMSNDATIVASGALTVASVGGSSASNIHLAELAANAATNLDTVSTIVKRDGSGNFSAGTITASLTGHANADLPLTGGSLSGDLTLTNEHAVIFNDTEGSPKSVTLESPATLTNSYTLKLPVDQASGTKVLQNDGSGNLSWASSGGGSPAGADTQIQFNSGGSSFGASPDFTYSGANVGVKSDLIVSTPDSSSVIVGHNLIVTTGDKIDPTTTANITGGNIIVTTGVNYSPNHHGNTTGGNLTLTTGSPSVEGAVSDDTGGFEFLVTSIPDGNTLQLSFSPIYINPGDTITQGALTTTVVTTDNINNLITIADTTGWTSTDSKKTTGGGLILTTGTPSPNADTMSGNLSVTTADIYGFGIGHTVFGIAGNCTGGNLTLTSGSTPNGNTTGGNLTLTSGECRGGTATGGNLILTTGNANLGPEKGGNIILTSYSASNGGNVFLSGSGIGCGQIGIGIITPDASSSLDVTSTTRGFLPPRMTTTQRNAISTPAEGLVVYDTNLHKLAVFTTVWEAITSTTII